MSAYDSLPQYVGWFGKIPSLGDFVRRNLPESFVAGWDEWLSGELSQAQWALADQWSQTWRCAPLWCFSVGAGVLDGRGWLGILVPSVDRVGREFPLTIALSSADPAATLGAERWTALEELGRGAVRPEGSADRLDDALAAFVSAQARLAHDAETAASVAQPAVAIPGEGKSAWWRGSGGERRRATPIVLAGLPRGEHFRRLLQRSSCG